MDEGETNKQLLEQIKQLKLENELLKAKIIELEARLAQYENAHTPPSLRRGSNRKKDQDKNEKGKPGQRIGHKGVTRPYALPDRRVEVTMDRCPDCRSDLGVPFRIDSKIIEEIPKPQPVIVTEYKIAHYRCPCCRKEVAAKDPGCPHEGKFGNNVIAQATLLTLTPQNWGISNFGLANLYWFSRNHVPQCGEYGLLSFRYHTT